MAGPGGVCCEECLRAGRSPAERVAFHRGRAEQMRRGRMLPAGNAPVFLHKVNQAAATASVVFWAIATVAVVAGLGVCAWVVLF